MKYIPGEINYAILWLNVEGDPQVIALLPLWRSLDSRLPVYQQANGMVTKGSWCIFTLTNLCLKSDIFDILPCA